MLRIYSEIFLGELLYEGQFVLDGYLAQVREVEVYVAAVGSLESPARVNLAHLGP